MIVGGRESASETKLSHRHESCCEPCCERSEAIKRSEQPFMGLYPKHCPGNDEVASAGRFVPRGLRLATTG